MPQWQMISLTLQYTLTIQSFYKLVSTFTKLFQLKLPALLLHTILVGI